MKNFLLVFFIAVIIVSAKFALAPSQKLFPADEMALYRKLLAHLNEPEWDTARIQLHGGLDDIVRGALERHAMQLIDEDQKIEDLHRLMLSRRIVLSDGQMATVYYYEAAKTILEGDLRLNVGMYEKWQRERPQSPIPIVLRATNMLNVVAGPWRQALTQAGQNTEGFTPDQKKLEEVRQYLLANKAIGARDPYWFQLMVEVGIFQGRSEDDIKALVQDGVAAFPENIQLPILASNRFTTQWGGEPASLFLFAGWAQDLPTMKKRPDLYPRIYTNAMQLYYGLTLFKFAYADWPTMRAGLKALVSDYDLDKHRNVAGALACLGGDRRLTHEMILKKQDLKYFDGLWPDQDAFRICSDWAVHAGSTDVGTAARVQDAVQR